MGYIDPDGLCRRGFVPMNGNPNACMPTNLVKPDRCITAECGANLPPKRDLNLIKENSDADCVLQCVVSDFVPSSIATNIISNNLSRFGRQYSQHRVVIDSKGIGHVVKPQNALAGIATSASKKVPIIGNVLTITTLGSLEETCYKQCKKKRQCK